MKVKHKKLWCARFNISIGKKHTIEEPECVTIKTAPQVQTSNLTCTIDSPDNALKETLFALNNIKMPTTIYNPILTVLRSVLLASSVAQTAEVLLLFVAK